MCLEKRVHIYTRGRKCIFRRHYIAVWDLWVVLGINLFLYCYLRWLVVVHKGRMGTTECKWPSYFCLVRNEAPQVLKLQSCISQHCHNSFPFLLLQACLFSQDSRSIRQCEEYSYYFIPQDQKKKNQINSVKHKWKNRGFVITLIMKPWLNHRAFSNSLSDQLR